VLEARDAAGGRVDGENATGAEFVGRPHTAPRSLFPIGTAMWRLRATARQLDASAPWRSAGAGESDAVKLATWLSGNGATKSGAAVGGLARSDSAPGPTQWRERCAPGRDAADALLRLRKEKYSV
jgi:hypothetical protein